MNFRKRKYSDPNPIHFSPTELCKCPLVVVDAKKGITIPFTEFVRKQILDKGSVIHKHEAILRDGSRNVVKKDLHMTIIHTPDNDYIISGYLDFNMFDLTGMYIEDLKSCDKKAFYHFNNGGPSEKELLQVSVYAFLYYVLNWVEIKKGVITKIDRENPRNRMSLEMDLIPVEDIEIFIEEHPAINFILEKITKKELMELTKVFIRKNKWMCAYCKKKGCKIKKELKKEDKDNDNKNGTEKENSNDK